MKETDLMKRAMYDMDFYHKALENGLIIEDRDWYPDEIMTYEVSSYNMYVQEKIKEACYDYVKQELGDEYELIIAEDSSPYHVVLFINVYCNGEKVCARDEGNFYWSNGKKDIHLHYIELVMPAYIDVQKQKFRLTKEVQLDPEIEEIKYQINLMKKEKIVTVNSMLNDVFY